jgi:hypothetical protein
MLRVTRLPGVPGGRIVLRWLLSAGTVVPGVLSARGRPGIRPLSTAEDSLEAAALRCLSTRCTGSAAISRSGGIGIVARSSLPLFFGAGAFVLGFRRVVHIIFAVTQPNGLLIYYHARD